jgi:glycosyltransferase involved in cell wall biosynthesis
MCRPLVSIVTPCLNAGRFIEETILSVLTQDYPRIEYVVMDGGSTDGTLEILSRYGNRLRYFSGPDGGQAAAVNHGFDVTHGEIFAFLNGDDTYAPGAISSAVAAFDRAPDAAVVYGEASYVDEAGRVIGRYPVEPFRPDRLARRCIVCQPAAFIRREAFAGMGRLDERLRFALDYDLWIRIARRYPLVKFDSLVANSRLHAEAKTVSQTSAAMRDTMAVLQRHYGYVPYNWIYGYSHHLLTGQPVAAELPDPSLVSAGYSFFLGWRYNWRHPLCYWRDILSTAKECLP